MKNIHVLGSFILALIASLPSTANGQTSDLPKKAIERSQLTLTGSRPFMLKARVVEATNLENENYRADIEEYWAGPDKWRRTVKTNKFSEILVVNGEKIGEQITGDYYPNWLRTIVTAIFDPGSQLDGVDLTRSSDNPMVGGSQICRRFTFMAGVAPVSNKVFSSFCFQDGLLESIGMPGFRASYKNYKNFAGKRVARTIGEYIESGTELEATITDLKELNSSDETQFAIPGASAPLQTVKVREETLRGLALSGTEIAWPPVRSGATKGTLSLYVCLDRTGRIREVYELNSSNAGLSEFARDQVMKWQFKTALSQGVPVQVESILTFAFDTALGDPIPIIEEQDGSKLIVSRVDPPWSKIVAPPGMQVLVTLSVNESGDYKGLVWIDFNERPIKLNLTQRNGIEELVKQTLPRWKFEPYVRNGKVTEYQVKVRLEAK